MSAQPSGDPLITAAREWYDAGFCVIPSHEDGSKRPFGRWKEYQQHRPEWSQVEAWLASGKFTGIGVICGAASGNVEMLELEGPMADAVVRLQCVIEEAASYAAIGVPDLLAQIARGCVEQSAGGGLHLFIRITDGPAKGNTQLAHRGQGAARKVISETRGEGGFVIVAPTPGRNGHPEGASYLFINGGHPSKTVDVTAEERDTLHMLFTLALNEAEVVHEQPQTAPRGSVEYEGESAFDDFRQRVTWREILEPAGWTWSHQDAERDYWTRPGKSTKEGHSASTIEDGPFVNFSSSVDLPQMVGHSKGSVYAHLHHGGDLSAAARSLNERGYGSATVVGELPSWEAGIDPDATPAERAEAASSWVAEHLPRLDWHALWKTDHHEEWIVKPLLAARRLVALYSAPKVGKSLLMLEIAAAVANGRGMFGYEAPPRAYRTLYVDFENDPQADIRERLTNMGYGPDDLDNLVLLSFPTIAKFDTKRGAQELMAAVEFYGAEIVVIDTVSRAVQGEENENDTWLNFYKHTGLRLKQAGVAMIRLDHAGKDEAKGQRGGSAKSGDVDAVWRMSKDGDEKFDLVCEAMRFPIYEARLTIRRVDDDKGLRHEVVSNPTREKEGELTAALNQHRIDKGLSRTAAGKALRDAGYAFKGRIPEHIWTRYLSTPATFHVSQEAL